MSIRTNIPLFSEQRDLLFHKLTPNLEATAAYDDKTVQRTVIYDRSPRVTLVDSLQSKVQVENYHDLPALPLTDEQIHLIQTKIIPTIRHDGDQMLIRDSQYDKDNNIIYVEAVRTKFSILRALTLNLIHFKDFPLFRTGVLSPLVTCDKKILFIQRKNDKLFSVPGGFLEPVKGDQLFMDAEAWYGDCVRSNALKELHEEVFHDFNHFQSLHLSSNLGISMRYTQKVSLPVMEFIQPIHVKYTCTELIEIFNNNKAVDQDEHDKNYWVFDFSTKEALQEGLKEIGSADKPGYFLYLPMIETILPKLKNQIRGNKESSSLIDTETTEASPVIDTDSIILESLPVTGIDSNVLESSAVAEDQILESEKSLRIRTDSFREN
eukprot:gene14253-15761_t